MYINNIKKHWEKRYGIASVVILQYSYLFNSSQIPEVSDHNKTPQYPEYEAYSCFDHILDIYMDTEKLGC